MKHAFFGSSDFSIFVLNELEKADYLPTLIITAPDKPKGRKLVMTPTPVKIWAEKRNIKVLTPNKLDSDFEAELKSFNLELMTVASYGKIIPKRILDIPKHGFLNVHPSLLPKYRGASPLQSMILANDSEIGVTIIKMDELMDHGPIVIQEKVESPKWPLDIIEITELLGKAGGILLVKSIKLLSEGKIILKEQDHEKATFTKKINKEDGLIYLDENENQYLDYLKYCAFKTWPGVFFFINKNEKKIRVKISNAEWRNGSFNVIEVIPEGNPKTQYQDFLKI